MKRMGISMVLILFCFSSAYAKLINGYGLKTGVVIANQDFDHTYGFFDDTKNRTGFDFGVYMEWFNLLFLSMLIEAHYVQKGMIEEVPRTNEFGDPISPIKHNNRVDYLSIPILAKITFETKHVSPYLAIGPRFDFLLDYKSKILKTLYKELKDMDTGGTIGIGVESKTEPLKMLLEFRYSPDFTNAYKTDLLKVKNNSFEILFGLRL